MIHFNIIVMEYFSSPLRLDRFWSHPASYATASFLGSKAAGAWSWPFTSI